MALITIQSSPLTKDQKKRIGDQVIEAFHREGIPASSVVLLFQRESADILLDGGLLIEASAEEPRPAPAPVRPVPVTAQEESAAEPNFKTKARRNRNELDDLKLRLVRILQSEGALTSFQAQEQLGLKDCDWAPATLRRFFAELEEKGAIGKQGQKRGTRYLWKGLTGQQTPKTATPKLVKKAEPEEPLSDENHGPNFGV